MKTEVDRQWFILNYIKPLSSGRGNAAADTVSRFNSSFGCNLELFAPTIVKVVENNGRHIKKEVPLTYHYVFINGTLADVKKICGLSNGFSFVLSRGDDSRYATLSDRKMEDFMRIARAYSNTLPFYDIADIDLELGDKVEVVEGSFPGLVGYYIPRAKSTTGDIVLSVTQQLGTIVYDVKAKYVRVLEFSKRSKRGYDQIDAFVPRLLRALRRYNARERLSDKELSDLTIFCRRMEVARIDNHKIDGKLAALLACASRILGDSEGLQRALARLEKRRRSISSPWTIALIHLLEAVSTNSHASFAQGLAIIESETGNLSAAHRLIKDEYQHYRGQFIPDNR